MGIEEAILHEVEERGIKKGIEKGKAEAIRNMLQRSFSDQDIKEILNVDQPFIDKVRVELS